ncbi:MAG: hypothetical protein GXP42_02235, partial [Chloroflexi bacterium]|nr:hypothetical protein [Chloroflexota bacterium]
MTIEFHPPPVNSRSILGWLGVLVIVGLLLGGGVRALGEAESQAISESTRAFEATPSTPPPTPTPTPTRTPNVQPRPTATSTPTPALSPTPIGRDPTDVFPTVSPPNFRAYVLVKAMGPRYVSSQEVVTLKVELRNVGWETARDVTLLAEAESGLMLAGVEKILLPPLAVGEELNFDVNVKVLALPGEKLQGRLLAAGGNQTVETQAGFTAVVRQDAPERWRPKTGADVWQTQYGHLEIELPTDRDERVVEIHARGIYDEPEKGGAGILYRFELHAFDNVGQAIQQFTTPITLRWRYAEALEDETSIVPPHFVWLDPQTGLWERIPTRADEKAGVIEAEIQHFSTFGVQNGVLEAPEDQLSGLEADLFSGGLKYRYRIPLLQRPGGFAPDLSLNYSSRRREDHDGGSFGSLLGWGWKLDIPYINWEYLNEYKLVLGGVTYTIVESNGEWQVKEAPWIRVNRSDYSGPVWHVRMPDGIYYQFQEELTSYNCNTGQTKGKKFMLTNITSAADDGSNQYTVNFYYNTATRHICGTGPSSPTHVFDVWPTKITYNGIDVADTKIVFSYYDGERGDWPEGCQDAACSGYDFDNVYYHTKVLKDITLLINNQQARRYHFKARMWPNTAPNDFACHAAGDGWCRLLLDEVQVFGKNDQPRPALRFRYTDENTCRDSGGCLLEEMDNSRGGKVLITYQADAVSLYHNVINRITSDAMGNPDVERRYIYGAWNQDARGYDYAEVRNQNNVVIGKHWFHIDREGRYGKDWLHENLEVDGSILARNFRFWWLPEGVGTEPEKVHVLIEDHFERRNVQLGGNYARTRILHYAYNMDHQGGKQYGNVTHTGVETFDDGVNGRYVRVVERWYWPLDNESGPYIVNRMGKEEIWSDSVCVQRTNYYYDDHTAYNQPPSKGLLTKVERKVDSCSDYAATVVLEENTYDPTWHNLTRTQDGEGRGVTYTYESLFHTFVETETNDKNHVTRYYYDDNPSDSDYINYALGLVYKIVDANNEETVYSYDAFGRPQTVNRPLGASVDEQWTYYDYVDATHPRYVVHKVRDDVTNGGADDGYLTTWTFYDGLGRVLQTQSEAEAGGNKRILISRSYDENGRLAAKSIPYYETVLGNNLYQPDWNGQPRTEYEYDGLGRVTRATYPDGGEVQTFYHHLQTAVLDQLGHLRIRTEDGIGRLVKTDVYTGTHTTVDWNNLPTSDLYANSRYAYNARDQLTDVWDPANNYTEIVYDLAGRKTQMTDPDMGTWHYRYDDAGNLAYQMDARGQILCFYYDELNRLTHRVRSPGGCASNPPPDYFDSGYNYNLLARFYYDGDYPQNQVLNNGTMNWPTNAVVPQPTGAVAGRLTAELWMSANPDNWRIYHYDARGRVTKVNALIKNHDTSFTTVYTYDALDRVKTMQYPVDQELLTYAYNSQGLPESLSNNSGDVYVQNVDYDALGRITTRVLGNGVYRTTYDYYDWSPPSANAGKLRVIEMGTASDPDQIYGLSYTYDATGNILSLVETTNANQKQCFEYDALGRLVHGFTGNDACMVYDASRGSGVYDRIYKYEGNEGKAGNMTALVDNANGVTYNYDYSAHKLTHVNGAQQYQYDAAGNMITRESLSLNYDYQNRLSSMWENGQNKGEHEYDADGQRRYEYIPVNNTTRRYVGEHFEYHGFNTYKKYYYLGGVRVAFTDRVNGVDALYWLGQDHLGSTALSVQSNGSVAGRWWYHPYGKKRAKSGALHTTYRFTGQRWDSATALYYYGARWYDATIGRFVQADTIVPEPGDPMSLNRYLYTLGNPVRFTDPTGHYLCVDTECMLGWNETTERPFLRTPPPQVVRYIHQEMVNNAQGPIAEAINTSIEQAAEDPVLYVWANVLWGSQVMDARIKENVPAWLARLLGNWDHKQIILEELKME